MAAEATIKLAITVDDLFLWRGTPMPEGYDASGIAKAIRVALARHRVSDVYAFSHTAPTEDDRTLFAVFDEWVAAGHHIANHSHHHANINWVSAQAYIDDIERSEALIAPWSSRAPVKYFRFCMDAWGSTPEKHEPVREYLRRQGYIPAPISNWFYDTEFLVPYWRAASCDDQEAVTWLRRAFIDTAVRQLAVQDAAARAMFGGEPVHIWLIHGTPLAADCLNPILDRFAEMGVKFVALEAAMEDAMNREPMPLFTPRFLNQVQKWAELRGVSIEDCPPAILSQVEAKSPMPNFGSGEVMTRVFRPIAEQLGGVFSRRIL